MHINPFKTMVRMHPFAPESDPLRTGYIDPSKGYVSVRVDRKSLVEDIRTHQAFISSSGVILS
eukprot:3154387-Prorocentrum_lima.AAC.1